MRRGSINDGSVILLFLYANLCFPEHQQKQNGTGFFAHFGP